MSNTARRGDTVADQAAHEALIRAIVEESIGEGGGEVGAGSPVVRKFTVSHDMDNLWTSGVELFVPSPGDLLLDYKVAVTETWDGTTPQFDFGSNLGYGFFYTMSGSSCSLDGLNSAYDNETFEFMEDSQNTGPLDMTAILVKSFSDGPLMSTYVKFKTDDPVVAWVSSNGYPEPDGEDAESTQGSLDLYVTTCTPSE